MSKWECSICGYIYDPEIGDPDNNVAAGTTFEALPDNWECPLCGAPKEDFNPLE
jgi:rubredoxin